MNHTARPSGLTAALATGLVLSVVPLLAGCGKDDGDGASVVIDARKTDGNFIAGVDGKTGEFSINAPGITGKIALPKIKLDESAFRLNGVRLYPGSTIDGLNIDERDGDRKGEGSVRVTFESPADAAKVRDWFADKMAKADFKLSVDGTGLSGVDDEGRPVKVELTPAADGKTRGIITAGH